MRVRFEGWVVLVLSALIGCHATHGKPGQGTKASPVATWSAVNAGAPVLSDIVWSGAMFVAVGENGTIVTSTDGSVWTPRASGVARDLGRIVWSGTGFLATAGGNAVVTSADGVVWAEHDVQPLPDFALVDVTWSSGFNAFLAAGDANGPAIAVSPDGATWTAGTVPEVPGATLSSVACAPNACLAAGVAPGGTFGAAFVLESNDAIHWQAVTPSANLTSGTYASGLYSVVWSGTEFLALGSADVVPPPSYIATSVDGAAWGIYGLGPSTPGFLPYLNAIRPVGSQLFAIGASGTVLMSSDGATWTSHGSAPALDLVGLAGSATTGTYAAIAARPEDTGTGYAALLTTHNIAADTIAWSENLVGFNLASVAWVGTQYIAIGSLGTVQTSVDGRAWTSPKAISGFNLHGIVSNGNQTIIVGAAPPAPTSFSAPLILSSHNNLDWNSQQVTFPTSGVSIADGGLRAVLWSGTQFVAAGDAVFTSSDGTTWAYQNPNTTNLLFAIAWSGKQYAAVGTQGTLVTSPDAVAWTPVASGLTEDLTGIAWSGTTFVVVGSAGVVLTSSDARTWTPRTSGTRADLTAVTWTGAEFVAVGSAGTLLTSADGVTWAAVPAVTGSDLTGVASAPTGQTICVGLQGTLLSGSP